MNFDVTRSLEKHPLLSSVNVSGKFRKGQWAPLRASTECSFEAPLQAQNASMTPPPASTERSYEAPLQAQKAPINYGVLFIWFFPHSIVTIQPLPEFPVVQPSRLEVIVSRKLLFLSSQNVFYNQPEPRMFNEANSSVLHKLIKRFSGPPSPPLKYYLAC